MADKLKERIEYVDIAKGLAILCVIIGHMGWEYADRIIYPFHMPLFLICSGYFISEKKDFSHFRKEKAKRLLLPYVVTCVVVCVLSVAANLVQGLRDRILPDFARWIYASFYGSCIDYADPFIIKGIGQIWFLLALFWAFLVVKYFSAVKEGMIFVILLAYMAYISSQYIWLPFSIQAGGISAVFVYAGYELKRHHFLDKKFNIWLLAFAIAVWVFEVRFDIRVNLCNNTIDARGFSILGGVIICYVVIQIAKLCSRSHTLKVLFSFYGKNSMLILCFHEMETYFFPWSIAYNLLIIGGVQGITADFIVLLLKILFSTICTIILKKIANRQIRYLGFI